MSTCSMNRLSVPCASCPWRRDTRANDIPNFDMKLAESLADTCPDERNIGPAYGAKIFACHQSKPGDEFPCAGWLATVGHRHPEMRIAVFQGQLDEAALSPGNEWPELHSNYPEVLAKLRETDER